MDPGLIVLVVLALVLGAYLLGLHDHSHDPPCDEDDQEEG